MSKVVPGEVVPGEVVDVESPPAAVVDAQFESDDGREKEEAIAPVKPSNWTCSVCKRPNGAQTQKCGVCGTRKGTDSVEQREERKRKYKAEAERRRRAAEVGGPPADGRTPPPADERTPRRWDLGDLFVYFVFCPCAVGYFLWVSAPACWAALYEHVLAPVGGFVHDHLLVPLGKCLDACWGLLARACTALYKHLLVPIGTAVAAGAAATYNHVLVPIGTAVAAVAAAVRSVMPF